MRDAYKCRCTQRCERGMLEYTPRLEIVRPSFSRPMSLQSPAIPDRFLLERDYSCTRSSFCKTPLKFDTAIPLLPKYDKSCFTVSKSTRSFVFPIATTGL